nr:unnamed protein product [Spirometra erinaceieuropaei]
MYRQPGNINPVLPQTSLLSPLLKTPRRLPLPSAVIRLPMTRHRSPASSTFPQLMRPSHDNLRQHHDLSPSPHRWDDIRRPSSTAITINTPISSDVDSVPTCPCCDRTFTSHIGLAGDTRIRRTETGEPVPDASIYTRRTRLSCPHRPAHPATVWVY